ncbi:MAG: sulfur carrier protein ThiS [Candidatus Margulisbacteria bacterium]|nr:sulfur carrier protein ThiS [Candidatus Margulisiibacteriota bacterium]MBU1616603.1 sulfur carrier protein ThiS [Candidatus Margulisiibacteriota bacterium]
MKITVNGKEWSVAAGSTVADLLGKFKISPKVCAVELNGKILKREKLLKTLINEGDTVEVIRMMGGG